NAAGRRTPSRNDTRPGACRRRVGISFHAQTVPSVARSVLTLVLSSRPDGATPMARRRHDEPQDREREPPPFHAPFRGLGAKLASRPAPPPRQRAGTTAAV